MERKPENENGRDGIQASVRAPPCGLLLAVISHHSWPPRTTLWVTQITLSTHEEMNLPVGGFLVLSAGRILPHLENPASSVLVTG